MFPTKQLLLSLLVTKSLSVSLNLPITTKQEQDNSQEPITTYTLFDLYIGVFV